ncbi:DASS family sodium-coupled anion symporter [Mariprofundus ferrooxydans]|uniref:Sodium/sulphate symporter n=1 Tax=Mariprofundus ferrooxydans PV-1 TaxID=314345 RepID=Q0EZE6_9PROT|nr:DASS family sodium-coupled anion symporter [Mariprofundus ferrooxydans]EAU54758.1 Sodium/sulphate symporter [Mariprofundus ferrooxydans PV-1]KON46692.1 sodium/sulfate symporter [Mariprofundus ferrooxydans]
MHSTDLHPFANSGRTKLSLVSRGVALPEGLPESSRWIAQANATESVIDIRLSSGHLCTVPVGQPYTERSTYKLLSDDEGFYLDCAGESERVELVETPAFYRKKTRSGARMGNISSLHDRLLMLYPTMGCGFFAIPGAACQYCQYDSMLNEDEPPMRDPLELVEVVRAALAERAIDTVYLYNGFSPAPDVGLSRLLPVIALLRRHLPHQQIALETVAPHDLKIIDELYDAGLDIFVCNLEVADTARFAATCPGKASHGGQSRIWEALRHARSVFRPGTVVSHLIVGLEPLQSTIAGMKELVHAGVVPLLIPFRPLPGTPLKDQPLPSLDDVEQALLSHSELVISSALPTHRLRDMGRVLTPMESRVLDGIEPSLQQRFVISSVGRKIEGWFDSLRRHVLLSYKQQGHLEHTQHAGKRQPASSLLMRQSVPFVLMALIVVTAYSLLKLPAPAGLTEAGWHSLLVFGVCLVLWVSQLLPLSVTSLLGMALLPLVGAMSSADVYALFGNTAVFFILGAFILAAGIMKSGLSEHVALAVFKRFNASSRKLLLSMLLLPALMACFMPEHAVAAVLLPIVWSIVQGLGLKPGNRYAAAIFLAMAWGAVIGGVMTLLGGARGPLAMAIVGEMTGKGFSFVDWTLAAAPMVIGMLLVAVVILLKLVPHDGIDMQGASLRIEKRQLELGHMDVRGKAMSVLMLVTMMAWIFLGDRFGLATIALVAVVAMFALRIVGWKEIQSHIDWGVVLMYGGAIAIATSLQKTGAAEWVATSFWPDGVAGVAILILIALFTMLLTEGISNSAAVAIMLPIAIPMGTLSGIDPITTALAVGIVSGFAFMLPMGTPPNAMVYGTGYVRLGDMIRFGSILLFSTLVLFALTAYFWWPLWGFAV